MGEAVREPVPHEIQCGNCDESGFRTNHGAFMSDDEELPLLPVRPGSEEESSDSEEDVDHPLLRRSDREKRFPDRYGL